MPSTRVVFEEAHQDICWTMPTAKTQVLILSDDKRLKEFLSDTLAGCGVGSVTTSIVGAARGHFEGDHPEVILADLDSRGSDDLEFIDGLQDSHFAGSLIVLADENSKSLAREAMDKGAFRYLRKPLERWEVERAVQEARQLSSGLGSGNNPEEDVPPKVYGSSPAIQAVLKIVDQVARREDHLILFGEPGSGKRLIGSLIHHSGRRRGARFASLSCSGLSESVIDRELFGYRDPHVGDGSSHHPGCLESCDRGTLLLDEIGDLPRRTQEKILRSMTRRSFQLAGGGSRGADVRIIGTSSHDLEEKVHTGRFHRELFERLQGVRIPVPALREHRSDIPVLVDQCVRTAARRSGKRLNGVSPSALARLMQYDWPGNVRELKDMIEYAVSDATGSVVGDEDLPSLPEPIGSNPNALVPGATIQAIEKEAILRTLEATGGSTSRAAKILEMSVRKIQYKLKEYRHESAATVRLETVSSIRAETPPVSKKTLLRKKAVFVAGRDRPESQ